MKLLIFLVATLFSQQAAQSQELIFRMNQYGVSYKDETTNKYTDAEIKATDVVITLQDKLVKVMGDDLATFSLQKMKTQNSNINHLYTQNWKANDNNKTPMTFKYTVNVETKEAMIEVAYKDFRNYYFGKFSYGNIENPDAKTHQPESAAN